ncbi:MAG: type II secretion system GspH family protein [Puniceicoccales bacterium]|jgi:hypothetical protein|nr:type II secretion system GspH family protein [Puniceicoccales bacterium]
MFVLQNDKTTKCKNQSFTLLEIVFTITIIGILLAIFLPAMSSIKLSAQKLKDASNLQTVAAAWRECLINRGWAIDGKDPGNDGVITCFAEQLAGLGKTNISDMILNDPYVYISPGDKYASKVTAGSLCRFDSANKEVTYTGAFPTVTNFMVSNDQFLSYCFMLNLPENVPLDTTPLGFTRGLRVDGKWDEKAGLYGSKGGYVIYCDGHTVWFDGNKPAKFLHWNGQKYTSDIRQTVPSSTWISCGNPRTKADYTSDSQLVVLRSRGTGSD